MLLYKDQLTDLINKMEILNRLDGIYENASGGKSTGAELERRFSLAFIDLDYFKKLNDKYGHIFGDHILSECGMLIKENMGEIGLAGRYGGDEFILIFPDTSFEETFIILENIRRAISDHSFELTIKDRTIQEKISTSIGLSSFPRDGKDVQEVLRSADEALYRAKKEGRNRICIAMEEKKIPKTVYFTRKQTERIRDLSKRLGKIESDLYRQAVDLLIEHYDMTAEMSNVDNIIQLHLGSAVLKLVESHNPDIQDGLICAVGEVRGRLLKEMGLRLPGMRFKDNVNLGENEISFVINKQEYSKITIDPDDPDIYRKLVNIILENLGKFLLEI